jgi:hypothetical protein
MLPTQLGHWSNGNWFSNDAYKTRTTYFGSVAGTKTTATKSQSYYNDLDLLEEKEWNDSFKSNRAYQDDFEDDWSGFGKYAYKPLERGVPFFDDKTYHCPTCSAEVFVDEDACCVSCSRYIIDAETDVVQELMDQEEREELGMIIKPVAPTLTGKKTTYMY